MRVSGWLFLAQQTLSALAVLLGALKAARLHMPVPKLAALCLTGGAACVAGAEASAWLPAALWCALCAAPTAAMAPLPAGAGKHLFRSAMVGSMLAASLCCLLRQTGAPLLLAPAGAWGALLLRRSPASAPPCLQLTLNYGGRQITLTALADTGNLLRDPLTGLPVVVLSRRAAAPLFPEDAEALCPAGCRLMSVRTVTGTALMPLFRPDSLRLRSGRPWREAQALAGLAPAEDSGCPALVPAALIDHQGGFA